MTTKRALLDRVEHAVRRMGAQSIITSKTVADRFGLHTTDLEVLDLIFLKGPASAGDLAAATGLTSGAVTALIDRLVRKGYVARIADPADGRRVLVRALPDRIAAIAAVYAGMQSRMRTLWSGFSAAELAVVARFVEDSTDAAAACCGEMRRPAS